MPNPNPKTEHLPVATKKQLEALGVTALAPGEISFMVRVRGTKKLQKALRERSPKEIGELLERELVGEA